MHSSEIFPGVFVYSAYLKASAAQVTFRQRLLLDRDGEANRAEAF